MKHEFLERFQFIDTLIQEQRTGTPDELAQIIGVSERTIHRTIKHMKKLGVPIAFNLLTKSYYYTAEGSFVCAFSCEADNDNSKEAKSIVPVKSIKEYIEKLDATLTLNNN